MGLDQNDRNILLMIIEKFSGGPVGLDTWQQLWEKMRELWKMYMSHIF